MKSYNMKKGVTLIELMLYILISSIVVTSIFYAFNNSNKIFVAQTTGIRTMESARELVSYFTHNVKKTGWKNFQKKLSESEYDYPYVQHAAFEGEDKSSFKFYEQGTNTLSKTSDRLEIRYLQIDPNTGAAVKNSNGDTTTTSSEALVVEEAYYLGHGEHTGDLMIQRRYYNGAGEVANLYSGEQVLVSNIAAFQVEFGLLGIKHYVPTNVDATTSGSVGATVSRVNSNFTVNAGSAGSVGDKYSVSIPIFVDNGLQKIKKGAQFSIRFTITADDSTKKYWNDSSLVIKVKENGGTTFLEEVSKVTGLGYQTLTYSVSSAADSASTADQNGFIDKSDLIFSFTTDGVSKIDIQDLTVIKESKSEITWVGGEYGKNIWDEENFKTDYGITTPTDSSWIKNKKNVRVMRISVLAKSGAAKEGTKNYSDVYELGNMEPLKPFSMQGKHYTYKTYRVVIPVTQNGKFNNKQGIDDVEASGTGKPRYGLDEGDTTALADKDKDGIVDSLDVNEDVADNTQDGVADRDQDGIPDDEDLCPDLPNFGNNGDFDGDSIGDACDDDTKSVFLLTVNKIGLLNDGNAILTGAASGDMIEDGKTVNLSISIPNADRTTFLGWRTVDGAMKVDYSISFVMTGEEYIEAVFNDKPLVVASVISNIGGYVSTVADADEGNLSSSDWSDETQGKLYTVGDLVTLKATPKEGYVFKGWYDAEENGYLLSTEKLFSFSASSNRTVFALFVKGYSITNSINSNMGIVTAQINNAEVDIPYNKSIDVLDGTTVKINIKSKPGYKFKRWVGDLEDRDSTNDFSITLSEAGGDFNRNISTDAILEGLIGSWQFNGTIYDASGNGYNGVDSLSILPNFDTENQYLKFSHNLSQYVSLGDLNIDAEALTVSAWVRYVPYVSNTQSRIIGKGNDPDTEGGIDWTIAVNTVSSNKLEFRITTENGYKRFESQQELKSGIWYHVVGVYDGSKIYTYVDAVRSSSSLNQSGLLVKNSNSVWIGDQPEVAGSRSWNGGIDNVNIWSKALTEDEIKKMYDDEVRDYKLLDLETFITFNSTDNLYVNGNNISFVTEANGNVVMKSPGLTGDYVQVDDIVFDKQATFSAWIKVNNGDPYGTILGRAKDVSTNIDFLLTFNYPTSGAREIVFKKKTPSGIDEIQFETTTPYEWQLITVVVDGGNMMIYQNGIEKNSKTCNNETFNSDYSVLNKITVGALVELSSWRFSGYVDDVVISKSAISSSQILDYYNQTKYLYQ